MQAPNCQRDAKAQGEWSCRVPILERQSAQACFQTRALFCVTKKISSAPIFDPAFHSGQACVAGLPEPLALMPPCSAALANVGISVCHGSKDEAVSICKNLL